MSGSANQPGSETPTAWYRQFWPWFVFGLPALSVAAGIITVVLALSNPDEVLDQDQGTSSTDLGTATSALPAVRASDRPA